MKNLNININNHSKNLVEGMIKSYDSTILAMQQFVLTKDMVKIVKTDKSLISKKEKKIRKTIEIVNQQVINSSIKEYIMIIK